jgi:nitroreductase
MDALTCLKTRRSVRRFLDRPVPRDTIQEIVDCGRMAATANNAQPWVFVAILEEATRREIAALTDWGEFIAHAPACIAVFCTKTRYYLEDGSAASQNILNAARAYGLGSCWVAGAGKPYAPKVAKLLGVPDDMPLVSLLAIGYPADEPSPVKKPLSDVLRWEKY